MISYSCSYDPEDDKLRLRASARLDRETYDRVKTAGFSWAPKQELFFAVWRPEREDLMLELCGEIDDEDTTLVERAEQRAERFEEYSDKRESDAERAHAAVAAIADNIPMGQPILVGHHSERHARRDAQRIENGMRRAVKLWETSKYWTARAAGALAAAKYKELPTVRHRRIKGLESDKRREVKRRAESMTHLKLWGMTGLTREQAMKIANYDTQCAVRVWSSLDRNEMTVEEAARVAIESHTRTVERAERWISHLDNRLAYERAMLDEGGGLAATKFDIKVGGRVLVGGRFARSRTKEWLVVERVNKGAEGRVNSLSCVGVGYSLGVEYVEDYRDPEPGDVAKVKKATALPPLVNYPGEGFVHMTKAEWERKHRAQSARVTRCTATATHGPCRIREGWAGPGWQSKSIFVTDMPVKERPLLESSPAEPVEFEREVVATEPVRAPKPPPEPTKFDALTDALKAGVQVVVNPDLFPTPPELARRVGELADVKGRTVLEPSAGTGALADVARDLGGDVLCVEPDTACLLALRKKGHRVVPDDIMHHPSGHFERVVMNPPFSGGRDVAHVLHVYRELLAPGGRLVAIVSAGARFRRDSDSETLRTLVARHGTIEDLPEGSFKSAGTSVRTCLVVLDKPGRSAQEQQMLFGGAR